jgi:hypothetical protein
LTNEDLKLRYLLYQCIVELEYVQCVEMPGDHSMCRTPMGKLLIEDGMKALGVKDLSAETLLQFARAIGEKL